MKNKLHHNSIQPSSSKQQPQQNEGTSYSTKNPSFYSLKPQRLSTPKDISTVFIFQSLIKEVNSTFCKSPKKIELTHILVKSRFNIITKFKRFIEKYRLSPNTFFHAVYIMDTLIARKTNLPLDKIE